MTSIKETLSRKKVDRHQWVPVLWGAATLDAPANPVYRELGFELKQIKRILGQPNFDTIAALRSHRKVLFKSLDRTRKLVQTIDKTIEHLKGKMKMESQELFVGFSPEQQSKHEQYLIDRFGEGMKDNIADSKEKVKNWTKAKWEKSGAVFAQICQDLVELMARHMAVDSGEVQDVIGRHHRWLKQFWTPTAESYAAHGQLIVDSELRDAYEAYHPGLPEFAAAAIKVFADRELS